MLQKAQRLSSVDILELKKNSKRVMSTLFFVLYTKGDQNRFSVTVPKKIYKNAVDRNTAKRKVSAIISKLSPAVTGDYSINVRFKINDLPHLQIEKEIITLLCQK